MGPTADCKNLLECAYYWEKNAPDRMYFTQPMGGGDDNIKTWTWKEAVVEARRMAAYLKSLDLPERSHIGIFKAGFKFFILLPLCFYTLNRVADRTVSVQPISLKDLPPFGHGS